MDENKKIHVVKIQSVSTRHWFGTRLDCPRENILGVSSGFRVESGNQWANLFYLEEVDEAEYLAAVESERRADELWRQRNSKY